MGSAAAVTIATLARQCVQLLGPGACRFNIFTDHDDQGHVVDAADG